MDKILDKIHSTGYWRVNIRPFLFNENLIPSLTEAQQIIEKCGVLLRGWDYPHFTNSEIINGDKWIESSVDFSDHIIEYWRFYQSGQFIHHFCCSEDYELKPEKISTLSIQSPSPSGKYLSILSTLYTITEIFQFASRLASNDILSPTALISIELNGMQDRQLFFWDRSRHLRKPYISKIPTINFEEKYNKDLLIAESHKLAMKATIYIFERFNWPHHSDIIFPEEQNKLLERRL